MAKPTFSTWQRIESWAHNPSVPFCDETDGELFNLLPSDSSKQLRLYRVAFASDQRRKLERFARRRGLEVSGAISEILGEWVRRAGKAGKAEA